MQHESSVPNTWQALSAETEGIIERASPTVVAVHARRRIPASGVHWRAGIIVTADHVLGRYEDITVTLPDGRHSAAVLAGRDPSTDLAILRLENKGLPVVETCNMEGVKTGHWMLAVGRTSEGLPRASLGLIGVIGPPWRTWRGGLLDNTIRLDRNLHPNFSGGPAVDHRGKVIGINTAGLSRYAAVVIPASTVDRVTAELEKKGHVGRGYLGVGVQPVRLPRAVRETLKAEHETGIMIVEVHPGSPAERDGLMLGDVLISLDDRPMRDVDDLQTYLAANNVGRSVKASILRGGILIEVAIVTGERPRTN